MKSAPVLLAAVLPLFSLVSCATPGLDPTMPPPRPHVPQVTMSQPQNQNEQALIGEVESTLERNGLRATDRQGVEYQLAFSVLEGPVRTDVSIDLIQGRDRVVHAFARSGGPLSVFKKQQVVREAFDKALQQFEAQLPRTGSPSGTGRDSQGYRTGSPPPYSPQQPSYGEAPSNPYGGSYPNGQNPSGY